VCSNSHSEKGSGEPAQQCDVGVSVSTTTIAVWQDWVSAVKVGNRTNGNVEAYEPGGSVNSR